MTRKSRLQTEKQNILNVGGRPAVEHESNDRRVKLGQSQPNIQ